jgi:hypothetical protein
MAEEDQVFNDMRDELYEFLKAKGLDTKNPPKNYQFLPSAASWREYKKRGGLIYTDPQKLAVDLVAAISNK